MACGELSPRPPSGQVRSCFVTCANTGVRLRDILAQQGVGLRIQCGGMGFVGHQLCVDEHIQACGLQGCLAQGGCTAVRPRRHHAAFGGVFFHQSNALGALFHDLKWHGTGGIQRLFQHGGFVCSLLWCVLGQAVGAASGAKASASACTSASSSLRRASAFVFRA